MLVTIVRHGQSLANKQGVIAGSQLDSPLTSRGENDAVNAGKKLLLTRVPFGRIVASPLIRAYKTAQIIAHELGTSIEIETDSHFVERNVGDATGMELKKYYQLDSCDIKIPNAETAQQMCQRIKEGLAGLSVDRRDVLLVAHEGVYRMIRCISEGVLPDKFESMPELGNGEFWQIEIR
jgi:broad specificity phosphatase PhoE